MFQDDDQQFGVPANDDAGQGGDDNEGTEESSEGVGTDEAGTQTDTPEEDTEGDVSSESPADAPADQGYAGQFDSDDESAPDQAS